MCVRKDFLSLPFSYLVGQRQPLVKKEEETEEIFLANTKTQKEFADRDKMYQCLTSTTAAAV